MKHLPLVRFSWFIAIVGWLFSNTQCAAFIVSWDASPDPAVIGYRVYCGGASGNYTSALDAGTATSMQLTDPPVGATCYVVVTAYAAASIESLPSLEVTYTAKPSGPMVTTSKSSYAPSEQISVNFSNGSNNAKDWAGIFPAGATNNQYLQWAYFDGTQSGLTGVINGNLNFQGLPAGSYEARIFFANSFTLQSSASFTVGAGSIPLSNDANLSALSLGSISLSPAFTSATLTYTANVPNTTTSIVITPTITQANATVTVNGTAVPSGSASPAITLAVGSNTISTVVTAQDRITTKTYTLTITRTQSGNADLTALVFSRGAISPGFSGGTTSYTTSVPNTITSVSVTPYAALANAAVKVNGVTVPSGTMSPAIALAVGSNTISTVVTSPDGSTTKTYTLTVTRVPSLNADLVSMVPSAGTLSPVFASGTTSYSASVPGTTTSFTVTPTVADPTATVNVNGFSVPSGIPSPAITVSAGGTTITTVVTAQNGSTKTYTLIVTQEATSDVAGNYNGLATPTDSSTNPARHVGLGVVTVSTTGAFTGKITLGGSSAALAFSGTFAAGNAATFSPNSTPTFSIPRTGLPTLSLALNLDRQMPVTSQIRGILTDESGAIVSTIVLDRSLYTSATSAPAGLTNVPVSLLNPATDKGAYTAIFQSRTPAQLGLAATAFPQGDGWATLTVQPTGAVTMTGRLADGQAFTYSSFLSKNNVLPLYLTPYSGTGTVIGSLTFRDVAAQSDVDGVGVKWFKPANSRDTSYREGWANGITVDFLGSKFLPPAVTGKTPLGVDPATSPTVNGLSTLSDGGLVTSLSNNLSIGMVTRATSLGAPSGATAAGSLAVTLAANGTFSGSFTHPIWNTTPTFAGVVLQKTRTAGGYFLARRNSTSALQSGAASISTAVTAPASIAAN